MKSVQHHMIAAGMKSYQNLLGQHVPRKSQDITNAIEAWNTQLQMKNKIPKELVKSNYSLLRNKQPSTIERNLIASILHPWKIAPPRSHSAPPAIASWPLAPHERGSNRAGTSFCHMPIYPTSPD